MPTSFNALATDYDGTLATDGRVLPDTLDALRRLKATGRRLIMVTGRELPELQTVCPELALFDLAVVENGALLYVPADDREVLLTNPAPRELVNELEARGVERLSVGRAIIATWEPHEATVLDAIRELGLEYHVIFNKGAVMVLPSGVTKATGLTAALELLEITAAETIGIGDAENDHAFLQHCGFGVAVANAIPALKERVDWVTAGARGAGVIELVDRVLAGDLDIAAVHRKE